MVPRDKLVAPTAMGYSPFPKDERVIVPVFEKLVNPPPGTMSGVIVKEPVTLVLLGRTSLNLSTVGVAPLAVAGVMLALPELYS
jgi:hypothetical protein